MAELPPVTTVQQRQAEQMRVYWKVCFVCSHFGLKILSLVVLFQFIEGMLTNLGPLPLDKMQSMMRLAPGYDRTKEQLAAYLEAARREGLLAGHDGVWRLNT